MNNSILPELNFHIKFADKRINHIETRNDEIPSLSRKINPNKATGSDGISRKMLLLCDETVILPLQIIFRNIISKIYLS